MRVGVIFGGRSVEHDVSVVTGHQVMEVLAASHEVVPIYVTREGKWLSSPELFDLDVYRDQRWDRVGKEAFIPPVAGYRGLHVPAGRLGSSRRIDLDVIVPAIHGTYGEDGTLQGLLELADIPYTGSGAVASAVGMDKVAMKAIFRDAGLPVVDDIIVDSRTVEADADAVVRAVERDIGYPAFVKPAHLGSSVGIGRAADHETLLAALEVARRYDTRMLVERAMEGCIEINCSVLGGGDVEPRASVCEQPVAWDEFLTFSDKYLRGAKGKAAAGMAGQDRRIPAPISDALTKQVQENALGAFRAIGAAGVARVDSFVDESRDQTWVMEINTVPGSFSFYLWEASGLAFDRLVSTLLDIALQTHRKKSELLFSFDSGMLTVPPGTKSRG